VPSSVRGHAIFDWPPGMAELAGEDSETKTRVLKNRPRARKQSQLAHPNAQNASLEGRITHRPAAEATSFGVPVYSL
jgi:hypothetical protein